MSGPMSWSVWMHRHRERKPRVVADYCGNVEFRLRRRESTAQQPRWHVMSKRKALTIEHE